MNRLPVTHLLTPVQLQMDIKEKLAQMDKKAGHRILGGSRRAQQKHAFFFDDIHLASKNSVVGSCGLSDSHSPLLELICYMLRHRKLTDFTRSYEYLLASKFVALTTPTDYWRLPSRLTRGTCRLPFFPPTDKCLHKIFSRSIYQWLEAFPLQNVSQVANV